MIKDEKLGFIYTVDDRKDLKYRFQYYESMCKMSVTNECPCIVRLDGHNFGNLTKKFKKTEPFCKHFDEVMIECCKYMVDEFRPDFGFVGSDEISLIFKPRLNRSDNDLVELPFGGKVNKINSLFAAALSVQFSKLMVDAIFDSRVFNIPNEEVLNYLISRQRSLYTNAVSQFADFYIGKKATECMNSAKKIALLKEKNVDFYKECPKTSLYGTFVIKNGNAYTMSLNRSELSDEMINFIEYKM